MNENGYVEIPITEPEKLKKIRITADVTSPAGSAWGGAGCALCMNCKDKDGKGFWSSKSFSLDLGSNVSAEVDFDGTFTNDETEVQGVIADGKIEVQKWWDYSEKQEEEIADTLAVAYKKIEVIYDAAEDAPQETTATTTTAQSTEPTALLGDVNVNGKVEIADVILLSRYAANDAVTVTDAGIRNADLNADGTISMDDVTKILNIIARIAE